MRVFKTKPFARFASRQGISDEVLRMAVHRAEQGSIDADLGGGVIKQRLARKGQGKSVSFRSVILFRSDDMAFFVYGFAKNDRDNIRRDELRAFRKLADEMLGFDDMAVTAAKKNGTIMEIRGYGKSAV